MVSFLNLSTTAHLTMEGYFRLYTFFIVDKFLWKEKRKHYYKRENDAINFSSWSLGAKSMVYLEHFALNVYLFILFYLPHNNYKKYRKRRKKKWRGDLTHTIGAYESLVCKRSEGELWQGHLKVNTDQAAILLRTCTRKTKAWRKTGNNTILNILLLFRIYSYQFQ